MKKEIVWFVGIALFSCFLLIGFRVYGINGPSFDKTALHETEKHRGAHVFGFLDTINVQPFVKNNLNWITIVPYADQRDYDSPTLNYYKGDSVHQFKRDSMWTSQIEIAHRAGMKVFLKPHIWLFNPSDGKWRSDIFPSSDENWNEWKQAYREFIMLYAHVAEKNKVEMLCIGTEFTRLSVEKSKFWEELIVDLRKVYSGKLTYAANWYQEFEQITFWDQLDYIGVQAYFPLVKNEYPSVDQLSKGWQKHLSDLELVHKKYNKTILFTELGYKSTADSGIKPWEWIDYSSKEDLPISEETQANCYEAFFDTVWEREWFAGVHIWQMSTRHRKGVGRTDLEFTPQGKQAEKLISKRFSKE